MFDEKKIEKIISITSQIFIQITKTYPGELLTLPELRDSVFAKPPAVSVTGIKKKFEKIMKNEIRVWNLSPVFSLTLRVHSHEYQMVLRI